MHAQQNPCGGERGGSVTTGVAGPGGGGGGGRILLQACGGTTFCSLPALAVAGGANGIQDSTFDPYSAQPGASGVLTIIPECYYPLTAPVLVTPPNGSSTNDTTPTYSGTLATPFTAGTEVAIYVDGVELGA